MSNHPTPAGAWQPGDTQAAARGPGAQGPIVTGPHAPTAPRYFVQGDDQQLYELPASSFVPNFPQVATTPSGYSLTRRPTVAAAEALLGVIHPVLESTVPASTPGHWALVDYIGNDAAVVDSARTSISYGAEVKAAKDDQGLLMYLMENAHTSPFERVSLVFHLKLPLFVFAQLVRHRTAKLNSASSRYAVMRDEFWIPSPADWRVQAKANKQATSDGAADDIAIAATEQVMQAVAEGYNRYDFLLGPVSNPDAPEGQHVRDGVARELARIVLPQNLMTTIVWKIDLHNLLHFLGLRLDWHAQREIRVYAEGFRAAVMALAPLCWEAFREHRLEAARVSATDLDAIRHLYAFYKAEVGADQARANLANIVGKRAGKLVALLEGRGHA